MQLKKNDILEVRRKFEGLSPITEVGLENWHQLYKGNMIDSGGEIRLPPREEWYEVMPGSKLIVIRARVFQLMVELLNPEDGVQFTADRGLTHRSVQVLK